MGTPELSDSLLWSAQGTVGQSQLTILLAIYHMRNVNFGEPRRGEERDVAIVTTLEVERSALAMAHLETDVSECGEQYLENNV